MIKMDMEDFIYEVREEMLCYEEIGTEGADAWEKCFRKWLEDDRIKKPNVVGKGDNAKFVIADESEIFDIADEYLAAVEAGNVSGYWKNFK